MSLIYHSYQCAQGSDEELSAGINAPNPLECPHTHVRGIVNTEIRPPPEEEDVNVGMEEEVEEEEAAERSAGRERESYRLLMVMVSSQCLASRARGRYTFPLCGPRAIVLRSSLSDRSDEIKKP